jgi:hypothetical protein
MKTITAIVYPFLLLTVTFTSKSSDKVLNPSQHKSIIVVKNDQAVKPCSGFSSRHSLDALFSTQVIISNSLLSKAYISLQVCLLLFFFLHIYIYIYIYCLVEINAKVNDVQFF